jgi:LPS-assembly protein
VDLFGDFDVEESHSQQLNAAVRYHPQPGKALNLSYRYTRDQLEQVDLSAQWPLSRRWTGLMRWNYSLQDSTLVEGLGGVEYNGGCWAVRFVIHSFVSSTQERSKAFFLQFELGGFSRIGISPLELLGQSIYGFSRTTPHRLAPDPYYPGMQQE